MLSATAPAPDAADAFAHFYAGERPRVVAIARRILLDASAAEDVAQEVFAAFARRHRANAPYARRWLHAASAHTALNVLRGERRRREREARAGSALAVTAPSSDEPERAFADVEARATLRVALLRLGRRKATALALRYGGLTYAEIASALGVSVTSVGTILARAETALRKELASDARH